MSDFQMPKKIKKPKKDYSAIKYVVIMLLAVGLASVLGFNVYLMSLSPIHNLDEFKPNIVTKIYSADGEVLKTFTGYSFQKVDFEDIPQNIKEAIISVEDKNFYHHSGYDPTGLVRSVFANLAAGKVVQGASTITQQLARILFLSNEKTFSRKIKEFIISARIEKTISKDKILEMYLNNVYLGSGAYGVAAAAQIYFNKPLKELTLAESALIAGLPQAPSVYSPFTNPDLAIKRRNQVLLRLYKMRYITKDEYNSAVDEKLKLNPYPEVNSFNRAGYFVDYVMDELESLGFSEQEISQGGYKITTTLNYAAQKVAEEAVLNILNSWGLTRDKQQAAVFSFSPLDGQIYVYVGGKNYAKSQYDRVRHAVRPPGSAFKPFVYAAAIERGYVPNQQMEDVPFKINGWAPKNYGGKYRGDIFLYQGLMVSSNAVAAKLISEIGIRPVINICRALGITTPIQYDYTIALGSNGVKLYEISVAYGAFANDGFKVRPYAVEQIETSRGKVIYKAPSKRSLKVLDSNTASILTAMLKTVITSGTGRAADIGKPAAGKSGTTDSYKDAWFIGYTPEVTTGVWVGNDDNSTMNVSLTGGSVPALIWKDVMKIVTEPYGKSDFDYPLVELKNNNIPVKNITEEPTEGEAATDAEKPSTNLAPMPELNSNLPPMQKEEPPVHQAPPQPMPPAAPAPVPNKVNF